MLTSSNGNIFRVAGPLCGEFTGGESPSPVKSPHKGQWRAAFMFSLICAWINGWVNNCEAGDLRRQRVSLWRHRYECCLWTKVHEISRYLQATPHVSSCKMQPIEIHSDYKFNTMWLFRKFLSTLFRVKGSCLKAPRYFAWTFPYREYDH